MRHRPGCICQVAERLIQKTCALVRLLLYIDEKGGHMKRYLILTLVVVTLCSGVAIALFVSRQSQALTPLAAR